MGVAFTQKSADHSSRECFRFSFFCDRCGKSWSSAPIDFPAAGTVIDIPEVRDMLWMQEHRLAFERASLEAQLHFNYCPVCGRWVCDGCFDPLSSPEHDLCRDCAAQHQQVFEAQEINNLISEGGN